MDSYIGRSKEISKGDKNISDSLGCTLCAPFLFLLYFDFICDLKMCMAKWKLMDVWSEGK